ncbi:MAG: T9SS type A sorting domain-containing protein [Bacteroidia bacterium]|nr:T9SS type A sorting domain-containing protein [Bacteroidia bacterium]
MKNIFTSLSLFLISLCVPGLQPAFPQSVNKYLGQTPPGNTIRRFPPDNLQMLAVNGVWSWHGSPCFSPDCKEMFFVKYLHVPDRPEIWHTRLVNNQWTIPVLAPFGNQTVKENCPTFSSSGDTLFFYSERSGAGGFYQTIRQPGASWSDPQQLPLTLPSGLSTGWNLSLTKNRTLYLGLYQASVGGDIYRYQWINGSYIQPERLPDQVNSPSNEGSAFIDPDEEYMLFNSNRPGGFGLNDVYLSYRNREGGWSQAVNLGNWINSSTEEGFPMISPDGKYLFFNTARAASQDQGYNAYWVSAAFIDLMRPIAPDTTNRVVFYSDRDDNAEIYSMFPDGNDLKRLTNNLYTDMDPAWSNDGKQIAFTSDRDGNFELYAMNADGTNQHKLTNTGLQCGTPDWSPDGTKILVTVSEDTYSEEGDIGLINSDGSGFRILSGSGQGYGPLWTDDGSNIIFCSKRTGHFEIYLMDIDGNNLQQITRSQTDKLNARLSPDGQKIAYTLVSPTGTDTEIHSMNADGTGDIRLTRTGNLSKNPCWSSDGKQIFFQTSRFGNHEIYQMDADGKNQINVTRNARNDYGPNMIRKSTVSEVSNQGNILNKCELKNIWPNPADGFTHIEFTVSKAGHVDIDLIDQLGRPVIKVLDENKPEGNHQIRTDITCLSPGIYTIRMHTKQDLTAKKIIKN